MIRSAAGKVAWMARATTTVVGLAIMLALVFGVASTALGKNGQALILGKGNNVATKVTGLIGKVATGSSLVVKNPSGGSALGLSVGDPLANPATKTVTPMKVDSQAKVDNLNADQLDGNDSAALQKRVSGQCAVGSSIRTIDANGVVTCETDDDLSGDPALGDLSGNYPNPQIANGAVVGGIGGKIADNTVNANDIATGGVGSDEVGNGSLRLGDIAGGYDTRDFDFNTLAAGSCSLVIFGNFTQADVGDLPIAITPSGLDSRLVASSDPVGIDNNVHLTLCNLSNVDINPPSTTFHFIVMRP